MDQEVELDRALEKLFQTAKAHQVSFSKLQQLSADIFERPLRELRPIQFEVLTHFICSKANHPS